MILNRAAARVILAWSLVCPKTQARAAAPAQQEIDGGANLQPQADPEVRRLYEAAHRHFRAHEYDRASVELESAYARTGAPALLFDLGQAARLAGHCARAVTFYRRFLDAGPEPGARSRAEALLAALGSCAGAEREAPAGTDPNQPPPTSLAPAPRPAVTAAPPPPAPKSPAALILVAPGAAGGSAADHRTAPSRRTAALICAIAAVGLVATAGYFGARAIGSAEHVSNAFKPGTTWERGDAEAESTGLTSERVAIGAAIAGGIATSTALWLLLNPARN